MVTTVADFEEYTGKHGVVTIDGDPWLDVEVNLRMTRNLVSKALASRYGKVQLPGGFGVKATIKKVLRHSEAELVEGYMMTDTPTTGTATACLAETSIVAGTAVPITTDPATPSLLKITITTAPTTLIGAIIISGTDTQDREISETFRIPAASPIAFSVTGRKVFKTANIALPVDLTTTGGKFKIDGVAGASNYTVGDPKILDLTVGVEKGGKSIIFTLPDGWFSEAGLDFADPDTILEVNAPFEMHYPDQIEMDVVTP